MKWLTRITKEFCSHDRNPREKNHSHFPSPCSRYCDCDLTYQVCSNIVVIGRGVKTCYTHDTSWLSIILTMKILSLYSTFRITISGRGKHDELLTTTKKDHGIESLPTAEIHSRFSWWSICIWFLNWFDQFYGKGAMLHRSWIESLAKCSWIWYWY